MADDKLKSWLQKLDEACPDDEKEERQIKVPKPDDYESWPAYILDTIRISKLRPRILDPSDFEHYTDWLGCELRAQKDENLFLRKNLSSVKFLGRQVWMERPWRRHRKAKRKKTVQISAFEQRQTARRLKTLKELDSGTYKPRGICPPQRFKWRLRQHAEYIRKADKYLRKMLLGEDEPKEPTIITELLAAAGIHEEFIQNDQFPTRMLRVDRKTLEPMSSKNNVSQEEATSFPIRETKGVKRSRYLVDEGSPITNDRKKLACPSLRTRETTPRPKLRNMRMVSISFHEDEVPNTLALSADAADVDNTSKITERPSKDIVTEQEKPITSKETTVSVPQSPVTLPPTSSLPPASSLPPTSSLPPVAEISKTPDQNPAILKKPNMMEEPKTPKEPVNVLTKTPITNTAELAAKADQNTVTDKTISEEPAATAVENTATKTPEKPATIIADEPEVATITDTPTTEEPTIPRETTPISVPLSPTDMMLQSPEVDTSNTPVYFDIQQKSPMQASPPSGLFSSVSQFGGAPGGGSFFKNTAAPSSFQFSASSLPAFNFDFTNSESSSDNTESKYPKNSNRVIASPSPFNGFSQSSMPPQAFVPPASTFDFKPTSSSFDFSMPSFGFPPTDFMNLPSASGNIFQFSSLTSSTNSQITNRRRIASRRRGRR
ncbi:4176_t:CDS:1 [Paraglomus brasilianum]|uniref:4176_t:CDS:1 n=1 Tax=Paraglomus brasilianum TaxID=144538 RepID=A0A9N9B6X2_9GLOM|nr:4176_t:CDS:1 [Paraglomus brasilianum]